MELFALLAILWIGFLIIAPVWLLVQVLRLRSERDAATDRLQVIEQRLQRAETDMRSLRTELTKLRTEPPAAPTAQPSTSHAAAPEPLQPPIAPPAPPPVAAPLSPIIPKPPVIPPAAPLPPTPAVPPSQAAIPKPREVAPRTTPPATPPIASARPATPPLPPPPPLEPERDWRGWLDLAEEKFGTNWLNKLGVIILVFGVAFYLAYKLGEVGPLGKIVAGLAVSGAMLGAGIFYETRDRYRVLARTAIGGGWALLFFTVYAMHHVEAAKIISSQPFDLVLLLIVALAMVAHTLRYNSQVVTGLAFLLALATVTISQNTIYSLSAGAVLALGIAIIAVRRQWFELEVFGLLGSYLNHYFWLRTIIEPMAGEKHAFPEFIPSALLLILYWAIFRWSYIRRRVDDSTQENISTLAAILNTLLLLGIMKYQSVSSGLAFYVLLALGLIELALAQLPVTRRRRTAFVVLSTVGATLAVAAIPFRFAGSNSSLLWLAEAQAFLLAGVFTHEKLFRRFGLVAAALTCGNLLWVSLVQSATGTIELTIAVAFCALVLYADALIIPRRWKDEIAESLELAGFQVLSYLAAGLVFTAIWLVCDWAKSPEWLAIGWAAIGLLLAYLGWARHFDDLSIQAHLFAMAAFVAAVAINRDATELYLGVTLRVITFALLALILYASSRWSGPADSDASSTLSAAYTWGASACLAILLYYEAPAAWLAVAWAGFAFLLNYFGRTLNRIELNAQAHVLMLIAIVRALAFNLPSAETSGRISLRLATIGAMTILAYAMSRLSDREDAPHKEISRSLYSWAGSAFVALLMWYELRPINVALGWGIFALALFEIGALRASLSLRSQAYVAFALAFGRIFFVNLNAEGLPGAISPRLYTTLPLAIIFFYSYVRLLRDPDEFEESSGRIPLAALLSYFGTITLAALIRFEMHLNWVIVGWSVLTLALLALAWRASLGVFLQQAFLLSGAVAFRTVFHHFFEAPHSYPTWAESRATVVGLTIALLFAGLALAFPLRRRLAGQDAEGQLASLLARPEQWFFFLPFGICVALLALEVRSGLLTVAWGVLAVAVFLFAIWLGQRSFRWAGLVLLLVCVLKIVALDVWKLEPGDRYLTFIGLGAAMLLVSYLYTRYKEAIHQYL